MPIRKEDRVPALTLTAKDLVTVKADALVIGVVGTADGPRPLEVGLPREVHRFLVRTLPELGVTGAVDEIVRIPSPEPITAPVLVFSGLGKAVGRRPPTPEALRRAAGAATRILAGTATVALGLPTEQDEQLAAVAEGALFGGYAFARYHGAGTSEAKDPVSTVIVVTPSARTADARAIARRTEVLAAAVAGTRDLVNTPPVDLFPESFADQARAASDGLPITVTVRDEAELTEGGFGGLLSVGRGSSRGPRLVRLDYAPADAKHTVALVGKGVTFDSGGLSIKPAAGMEHMKSDMAGAAAVLRAVIAAAQLALPMRVTAWLALAENMPSGSAQRPSDVITIRGGRTVEVLNTDAEGRLVLADALVAAGEEEPDLIVDVATLTGAQIVALGNRVSAIMANDDELRSRVHAAADRAGEQFWPMPLPTELRSSLDSPVADLANIGERFGGMLVAGLFLAEFVADRPSGDDADGEQETARIRWAHLDVAGPAYNTGTAHGYTPVGGTGVPVRTLVTLLEDIVSRGV
jgi:leucyl aminopeptidase